MALVFLHCTALHRDYLYQRVELILWHLRLRCSFFHLFNALIHFFCFSRSDSHCYIFFPNKPETNRGIPYQCAGITELSLATLLIKNLKHTLLSVSVSEISEIQYSVTNHPCELLQMQNSELLSFERLCASSHYARHWFGPLPFGL